MSTRLLIENKIEDFVCCRNNNGSQDDRVCQFNKKTGYHISALITFICSALFHFYPLYLIIKDAPFFSENASRDFSSGVYITTGLSLMILYFVIQWACIIIEQKLHISTNASKYVVRLWVFDNAFPLFSPTANNSEEQSSIVFFCCFSCCWCYSRTTLRFFFLFLTNSKVCLFSFCSLHLIKKIKCFLLFDRLFYFLIWNLCENTFPKNIITPKIIFNHLACLLQN
ncbi:hypothetical protein RFI_25402 [Reticulomyxa filosa]|uniref:Uncharacterized protein n=1 Tax=Reticulomyxa filosa TaxID=46433 RepID=X6ME96_RETFI|nr:hypothetical protein RFI_25402 [Reticulomyxa filosa]|eukprot:ETO11971.1 hypothetical protein RFI_25402 [Reticulomyxa filosa]